MVEEIIVPTERGRNNVRRVVYRAQQQARERDSALVLPGHINRIVCRCVADNEEFILFDEPGTVYFASRSLWDAVFGRVQLKAVFCDGRYKQIPREVRCGPSSQFYSVLGEFQGGHVLPLMYAFIPDGLELTYRRLFRWLWNSVENSGGHGAFRNAVFLTDFELPAMTAAMEEMPIQLKGCFFHYSQCIIRKRDELGLRAAARKNRAIGTYFRRIQMLPLLPPQFHRISEALVIPPPPAVSINEFALMVKFVDYWFDTWGHGGRFDGLWDHSSNLGARTTNIVEGSHTKIRVMFPRGIPTLLQMMDYVKAQLSAAKSIVGPLTAGTLAPRYVTPIERERQQEILDRMTVFAEAHLSVGSLLPTRDQCKEYLDYLAARLAH